MHGALGTMFTVPEQESQRSCRNVHFCQRPAVSEEGADEDNCRVFFGHASADQCVADACADTIASCSAARGPTEPNALISCQERKPPRDQPHKG